ncbi:MAG TPA: apolipoprotein N-acyltransferase [Casimicrobiaceae bacterium]|nr:apolipoprotein N-acyltransferase [Casimicrobiaceae bacterium]
MARSVLAALAGALTVFGFAPFGVALLPVATLAVLFLLWRDEPSPRRAAWLGFLFGAGLFGAGVSWIAIALERFGGMPAPLALVGIAGFCAYLALWPALAGYATARLAPAGNAARLVAAGGAWTLAEWLRGFVLSGFPWLAVGHAQLPGSPLAGLAPVGGVFLVSLAVAAAAALVACGIEALARPAWRRVAASVAAIAALFIGGGLLDTVAWTTPNAAPVAVSLVQGNIPQEEKFDPALRERAFRIYAELVAASRGRIVVLPESAFPVFAADVPHDTIEALASTMQARGGDVLVGLFTVRPPDAGESQPRIHNSVVTLGVSRTQLYRKRHLVPFGETIPAKPLVGWVIERVLAIPLSDQAPGPADQPPFAVGGERLSVNICYEDAFGGELAGWSRDATMLVNVTNDAWYGRSVAAWQHNQIAAMRAKETGRPMLRATNTGVTSVIEADGAVRIQLPWFRRGILETTVTGRSGSTPFMRWGNAIAVVAALVLAALAALAARRAAR